MSDIATASVIVTGEICGALLIGIGFLRLTCPEQFKSLLSRFAGAKGGKHGWAITFRQERPPTQEKSNQALVEAKPEIETKALPAASEDRIPILISSLKKADDAFWTAIHRQVRESLAIGNPSPESQLDAAVDALALTGLTIRFDRAYFYSYGSQIKAIRHIASLPTLLPESELRQFYEEGCLAYPGFHTGSTYESWRDWMVTQEGIVISDGQIEVTPGARHFLAYIDHMQYMERPG